MGVSVTQDVLYNSSIQAYAIDMSGWDYAIVQFININGYTALFKSTNDGGAVTGSVQDSAITAPALYLTPILGTNMADGTTASSASADGIYKFSDFGRYILLTSNGVFTVKVMLYKIG